jgi:starch synthase
VSDLFFTDGSLVNLGSDFALMPSLFEPGGASVPSIVCLPHVRLSGIVQHEFFVGGTPVIAFRTGGLKDSVHEFDASTGIGSGFNFQVGVRHQSCSHGCS